MRYENQNPQYIYLLEKIEELEREIKRWMTMLLKHTRCVMNV